MSAQTATADRDAYVNSIGAALANGTIEIRSGAQEANCAASDTGTLGVSIPLGATPFTTSSGAGQLVMTTSHNAAATGGITAGHFRAKTSGGVPRLQGTAGQASTAVTSALTAVNGDVLTFAVIPPLAVVGARLSGAGIPVVCTILAIVGATIVMSKASPAGVASGATITIDFDLNLDNSAMVVNQNVVISTLTYTPGDQ